MRVVSALLLACLAHAPAFAATPSGASAQALAQALDAGHERACAPVAYTLSGPAAKGERLFVSAPAAEFRAQLRLAAKGPNKLTKAQASELDRLLRYGDQAGASGVGFPKEAVERFAAQTGLSMRADLLCLSRETVSASPKR